MLTASDRILERVTAVTVTYNSEAVVSECLAHLPPQASCYVVDNASTDRTVDVVLAKRPGAAVYKLARNVGYGRANNFALRRINTEFALLLNPDGFIGSDHLAALVRAAIDNPQYGLLAPGITKTDRTGTLEPPSTSPIVKPRLERAGAIVLLRMDAGAEIGFFDEDFFLYGEDNDLCARLRNAGWELGYVKGTTGFHAGNASSGYEPGLQLRKNILMGRAVTHFRRKWNAGRFWRGLVLRRVVEHSVKAFTNLLKMKPERSEWHLGRAVGATLYFLTSSTGPEDRPQIEAALGTAAGSQEGDPGEQEYESKSGN